MGCWWCASPLTTLKFALNVLHLYQLRLYMHMNESTNDQRTRPTLSFLAVAPHTTSPWISEPQWQIIVPSRIRQRHSQYTLWRVGCWNYSMQVFILKWREHLRLLGTATDGFANQHGMEVHPHHRHILISRSYLAALVFLIYLYRTCTTNEFDWPKHYIS